MNGPEPRHSCGGGARHRLAADLVFGILSYAGIKLLGGRRRDVHTILYVLAAILLLYLVFIGR